jgi:hypothetical protein
VTLLPERKRNAQMNQNTSSFCLQVIVRVHLLITLAIVAATTSMRSLVVTVAITAFLSLSTTCAFIIPYGSPMIGRPLKAGASDYNNHNFDDAYSRNVARTCVRNFLTQRAIQSFTFLLESCRDPHTVRWLEVITLLNINDEVTIIQ